MKKLFSTIFVLVLLLTSCGTYTYSSATRFNSDLYEVVIEEWDIMMMDCSLVFDYTNKSSLALEPSFIFDIKTKEKTISSILLETKDVLEPEQKIRIVTGDFPEISKTLENIKCEDITEIVLQDVKFKNFKFRIN